MPCLPTSRSPAQAATGGSDDKASTKPGVFLVVQNADTSDKTVTFAIPELVDGQAVTSRDVTVSSAVASVPGLEIIPCRASIGTLRTGSRTSPAAA